MTNGHWSSPIQLAIILEKLKIMQVSSETLSTALDKEISSSIITRNGKIVKKHWSSLCFPEIYSTAQNKNMACSQGISYFDEIFIMLWIKYRLQIRKKWNWKWIF